MLTPRDGIFRADGVGIRALARGAGAGVPDRCEDVKGDASFAALQFPGSYGGDLGARHPAMLCRQGLLVDHRYASIAKRIRPCLIGRFSAAQDRVHPRVYRPGDDDRQ